MVPEWRSGRNFLINLYGRVDGEKETKRGFV